MVGNRLGNPLSTIDKKTLSESDICDLFISPAIRGARWDPLTQIRREVTLTPGPVVVRGNVASRNKKKSKFADYILYQEPGVPVAVVEAKDNHHTVSQGLQQALGYAEILDIPSAYSSNGDAFASHKPVTDGYPNKPRVWGVDLAHRHPGSAALEVHQVAFQEGGPAPAGPMVLAPAVLHRVVSCLACSLQ